MNGRSWTNELVVSLRFVSLLFGLALILFGLFLISSILEIRSNVDASQFILFYEALLALGILAGGLTLVHSIVKGVRIRAPSGSFLNIRKFAAKDGHKYGFTSALSIGLGATLGSPLFVLIPISILQNGIVGLVALLFGSLISFASARLYGRMYQQWSLKGREADGGPAFTRNACGRVSLRYFIARFGMWIGNTSLAAYSLIIFVNYSRSGFARTLQPVTGNSPLLTIIPAILLVVLAAWWTINAFFERRFGRAIGHTQIVTTLALVVILVVESALLFQIGNRPVMSILSYVGSPASLALATVTNTAFLFIHFFGFQEIQALSPDFTSTSRIPGLSVFNRFRNVDRVTFSNYAMTVTVAVASFINVFYALAVYSATPSLASLQASSVPAVFIARTMLGAWQGLFMGIAFCLASLTTFVPAFLASSRHLKSLSNDGFFPQGIGRVAWLFSLVSIVVLSLFNGAFLASITDFGVLVSLAFILLSAVWSSKQFDSSRLQSLLPLATGVACLLTAGALYLVDPSVVIFGVIFVMIGYLLFDIFELGSYGSQLFLVVLYMVFLGITGVLEKSGAFTGSETLIISARLLENTIEVATIVLLVNLALGARVTHHLRNKIQALATLSKRYKVRLFSTAQGLRERRDLDRSVDRWMRLMDSDNIASRDPENFERVKRHLQRRLAKLRD